METKEFLDLCISKPSLNIISEPNMELKEYKLITKHFNFPCNFDKYGRCIKSVDSMCCCRYCATVIGYIHNIRPNNSVENKLDAIKKYADLYNITTGFWNKDKGCVLPHDMRSTTCIGFVCHHAHDEFKTLNGKKITQFLKLLKEYNHLSEREKNTLSQLYLKIQKLIHHKGGYNG